MSKISFIGSGNMGSAIISGIISSGLCSPSDITATDVSRTALDSLSDTLRIATTTDNAEAAKKADILFLSVKPNMFSKVIPEIKESVSENTLIISIAAGMSISDIEKLFAKEIKLIRVMPNLNATVGEAMSALCPNKKVDADSLDMAKKIFESIGECEVVDEHLMDAVVAVSGSSPTSTVIMPARRPKSMSLIMSPTITLCFSATSAKSLRACNAMPIDGLRLKE